MADEAKTQQVTSLARDALPSSPAPAGLNSQSDAPVSVEYNKPRLHNPHWYFLHDHMQACMQKDIKKVHPGTMDTISLHVKLGAHC